MQAEAELEMLDSGANRIIGSVDVIGSLISNFKLGLAPRQGPSTIVTSNIDSVLLALQHHFPSDTRLRNLESIFGNIGIVCLKEVTEHSVCSLLRLCGS
jgi:hypothetical protein